MTWAPTLEATLTVLGALTLVLLFWIVSTSNRFARLRNHIRESWADIDVQLKRRHDLIPNLVETVRAYAAHERSVIQAVSEARQKAASDLSISAAHFRNEAVLVSALNGLFARVEAYPELKASTQFLALQEELASTEDRIAAARRFFNANVRDFNTMLHSFPSSLVGAAKGLSPMEFFEVDSLETRAPVTVTFADSR